MINNYHDFEAALLSAGFSMSGGTDDGIYAVSVNYGPSVRAHTGDPETDPWEWRIRVLDERDDIAYAKVFFKKGGFITKEWYPYFLAARRGGRELDEEYSDGNISTYAKRIYDVFERVDNLPLHNIKHLAGFSKEEKSKFDRALTELQMKMYLTMCGTQQKRTLEGLEYGWSSTVFCTAEKFFGDEVFDRAACITAQEAAEKITEQVLGLNPSAVQKQIIKFIKG